jgi:hypothetical protein
MPNFEIRFIKTVCNDTGHESQVCQDQIAVHANDLTEALRLAVAKFTQKEKTSDWTIYADTIEIRHQPGASRCAAA